MDIVTNHPDPLCRERNAQLKYQYLKSILKHLNKMFVLWPLRFTVTTCSCEGETQRLFCLWTGWTGALRGDQCGPPDELPGLRRRVHRYRHRQPRGEGAPRLRLVLAQLAAVHRRGPHTDAHVARQRVQPGASGPRPPISSHQVRSSLWFLWVQSATVIFLNPHFELALNKRTRLFQHCTTLLLKSVLGFYVAYK